MALALDEPKDTDHSIVVDGATFILDKDLAEKIEEVKIDFEEKGWRTGFVITTKNPIGGDIPSCGSCAC